MYVDGDHLYDAVRDDLIGYWPLIRLGGRLCGDDYTVVTAWWGDGVKRAVDDFASRVGTFKLAGNQWEIIKPLRDTVGPTV